MLRAFYTTYLPVVNINQQSFVATTQLTQYRTDRDCTVRFYPADELAVLWGITVEEVINRAGVDGFALIYTDDIFSARLCISVTHLQIEKFPTAFFIQSK